MKIINLVILLSFLFCSLAHADSKSKKAFPEDYTKKRVLISSDIGGGDPDDIQSMIHYLAYANMFDLEGIIISRPRGNKATMDKVIQAYRRDYDKFEFISPDYPTPNQLSKLVKVGAAPNKKSPSIGYSNPTAGSNWIIKQARSEDPRPLNIIIWGSATDVAQAVHDAPDIKKKIKVFFIGYVGYNYDGDPSTLDYLHKQKDLRIVESGHTHRGMYLGGTGSNKNSKYGNVWFVEKVISHRGSLGRMFRRISADIGVNNYGIKMGDTPSLLFLFNGDFDKPGKGSWGGKYCKISKNRYGDCPNNSMGIFPGAKTIDKHRVDILKDWEKRLKMIYDHNSI
jgi:hypothetical protein